MTTSPFKSILSRSVDQLKRNTNAVLTMDMTPSLKPLTLYSFESAKPPVIPLSEFATGSDADIGGLSTCFMTPVPLASIPASASTSTSPVADAPQSHVAFHGTMSLQVPAAYAGRIRPGYAAFRNQSKRTLWGEDTWDLDDYSHLRVLVGYRGWEGWRGRWLCNIQTDGPVKTDLFQHRLDIPPTPSSTASTAPLDPLAGPAPIFTTLHLPIDSFVLTNSGQPSAQQIRMLAQRIRTIGFALLGAGRREETSPFPAKRPQNLDTLRRLATPGVGAGEAFEHDAELEDLMRAEGHLGDSPQGSQYHRIGSDPHSAKLDPRDSVEIRPDSEGYYELSVKSVQAVNWITNTMSWEGEEET